MVNINGLSNDTDIANAFSNTCLSIYFDSYNDTEQQTGFV